MEVELKGITLHTSTTPGQLVLIMEKDTLPVKWRLNNVSVIHPGSDQKVQSDSIRYQGSQKEQVCIVNLFRLSYQVSPRTDSKAR